MTENQTAEATKVRRCPNCHKPTDKAPGQGLCTPCDDWMKATRGDNIYDYR